MLIKLTVSSISQNARSHHNDLSASNTTPMVFDSEKMFALEVEGSGAKFFYVINPQDRQDKAIRVTVTEAVSAIVTAGNAAWDTVLAKMPIEETVGGATTDKYVPIKSVTMAEQVPGQTQHIYVRYCEGGFKVREVMVPYDLDDLTALASTGSTSA